MRHPKAARARLSQYAGEVLHERLAPRERAKWEDPDGRDFIGALVRDIARDVFEEGVKPIPWASTIVGLAIEDCMVVGGEFVDVASDATQPQELRVQAALGLAACVVLKCVARVDDADASSPGLRDELAGIAGSPWLPTSAASVVRAALTGVDRRVEAARAFVNACRDELARTAATEIDAASFETKARRAEPAPAAVAGDVLAAGHSKLVVRLGKRDRLCLGETYLTWKRRDKGRPATRYVRLGGPEGRVLLALVRGRTVPFQKEPRAHVKAALKAHGVHADGKGESLQLREHLTLCAGVLERFTEIHPGKSL